MPQAHKNQRKSNPSGVRVVISNYYGDEPSRKIRDFCGKRVMADVKEKQREVAAGTCKGGRFRFQRDGHTYHVYCGENPTNNPGKFLYNVYIHPDADGKSNR